MRAVRRFVGWALGYTPSWIARRFPPGSAVSRLLRTLVNPMLLPDLCWARIAVGPAQGLWLQLNLRDEKHYISGRREADFTKALLERLKPGMRFWDVGANAGYYTLLGCRRVGPSGAVTAFEPIPASVERLRVALKKNRLTNAEIVPAALGCQNGDAPFEFDRNRLYLGRLKNEESFNPQGESMMVSVLTMEEAARRFGPPDLVKIDVEGGEIDVLRGMGAAIHEKKPVFLVEFHSEERLEEARQLLVEYRPSAIDKSHFLFEPNGSIRTG